jgi:hypothetical protein
MTLVSRKGSNSIIIICCLIFASSMILNCSNTKKETAEEFAENFTHYVNIIDSNSIIDEYLIDYETAKILEEIIPGAENISEMIGFDRNRSEVKQMLESLVEEREREGLIELEFLSFELGKDTILAEKMIGYENSVIKVKVNTDYEEEVEIKEIEIEAVLDMDGKWQIIELK